VLWCAGVPATCGALPPGQDRDTTRPELANFDVFLDGHPEIARQLKQNPSLVNNEEFLESHPALQQYLVNHPNVREELQENPRAFMKGEERFDRREPTRGSRLGDTDITRRQLASFDGFLDSHPKIAQQLMSNPSLIDNPQYVQQHPDLQQFLQTHSGVQEELKENPQAFMQGEGRFERSGGDITRGEMVNFDKFLDSHPAMAQQLAKDPSLVNNKQYVQDHPELQQFLQTHTGVRQELTENPQAFMQAEARFDNPRPARDKDITHGQLAAFDAFLNAHPAIAQQVSKDPSLVNNEEYVENHPELQQFLKAHSGVQEELKENPQAFTNAERTFDGHRHSGIVTKPKPTTTQSPDKQ
jgi:phage-related protein